MGFWLDWKKYSIIYQEETKDGILWGWVEGDEVLSITYLTFEYQSLQDRKSYLVRW